MTMLTHTRGPSKRAPCSSERQDAAEAAAAEAHPGMIKQFCMYAVTILLAGAALAGIIAIRAIAVLHTLNFNVH
jgi:hypothetical protein